jgi:DNA replication licensing factor MCM3
MDNENDDSAIESLIQRYMGKTEISLKIQEMLNNNQHRLTLNLDDMRNFNNKLSQEVLKNPLKWIDYIQNHLSNLVTEMNNSGDIKRSLRDISSIKKQEPYLINFEGAFGRNMVSPRGLNADLANNFISVQGIVTRASIVRPKLTNSVHYCDDTKMGSVKDYADQYSLSANPNLEGNIFSASNQANNYMSNAVPIRDLKGNPLSFEYGLSHFRDFQILYLQEPPERTPVGQLPRSVEIVLMDDLCDRTKPGDR